jgi:hypothetical protein
MENGLIGLAMSGWSTFTKRPPPSIFSCGIKVRNLVMHLVDDQQSI